MSGRRHKFDDYDDDMPDLSPSLPLILSPREVERTIANSGRSSSFPASSRWLDEKAEPSPIRVEFVDGISDFQEGTIVAFQFVSKGRWMWAIGTVTASDGDSNRKKTTDSLRNTTGILTLLCWKVVRSLRSNSKGRCDEDRALEEDRVTETAQESRGRLSRELYHNDVIRRENILASVRKELCSANQNMWNELLCLKEVPKAVMRVLQAVFSLLCIELVATDERDEWEQMKCFMSTDTFVELISDPNAVRVTDALVEFISKTYISDPLFDYTVVGINNRLAGIFQKWVASEVYLYKARASLRMIDDRLSGGVSRPASSALYPQRSCSTGGRTLRHGEKEKEDLSKETARTFSKMGEISFVRTDEKVVILQTSVFCKLVPLNNGPTSREMVLRRGSIALIRSAAAKRLRNTSQTSNGSARAYDSYTTMNSSRTVSLTNARHLLCSQMLERTRIMVSELTSLFDLHLLHTSQRLEILRRYPFYLQKRSADISFNAAGADKGLSNARNRLNELEFSLKRKDLELKELRETNADRVRGLGNQENKWWTPALDKTHGRRCGLNFHILCLLQEEEIARMRLEGIQTQERYQILLQESRNMKDICLRDLKRDYVKETIALRREISELESCQQKALVILRDCIIRSHEKPLKYHSNIEKEGIQLCLADVEQAMLELGGSRLPSTNLLSERSSLSIHHELFSNPTKKSVCVQTDVTGEKMRMREHTKNRNDMDVDHNDVILIKDRLVEAMYDREVIEGMLSREQEKCCRLEKDKNDLHLELERTAKQRAELNDEVVALRNKIKKLTNALEKTASHKRNTNGNELIKPSMEVDADTFDTLRTNNALREQWVISLLDQEGIDHSGGVFNALCTYIEQLKSRCVTTEADRDLQASEARMLEMCLKTAADALEDALLHDERWRPRTTKSKHTTWHTKKFPGEEWDTVVANMPEGLAMAITHDVAAACHLPEEYVLDIDYRDDETGLYVSFNLRHDPSITTEEITRRLEECNFYEMEKIYANRYENRCGIDELRRNLQEKVEEINSLREALRKLQGDGSGSSSLGQPSSRRYGN